MTVSDFPMTRARMYVLIDAFERDIRSILARFVVEELGEEKALGPSFERAIAKKSQDDNASDSSPAAEYLDLREGYDLLNTHRSLLPEELAKEVREHTAVLDRLVGIRKRVMHARPLAGGDSEAAVSLLNQFQTRYWPELKRMIAQLMADPSWEPLVVARDDDSLTLHNLPLPDYDETGLIGRSKEVSDLVGLIKRRRESVLTVTGEGGIGKTALALEVAYLIADDPERPFDAVLWTSLKHEKLTASGVREIAGAARDVIGAVQPLGRALDDDFTGSVRELGEALSGLRALVVVDNLETIGGIDFSVFYDELPDSVSYLITSRVGVGEFERRYPLSPMSEGDSLRLFNDFVRARRTVGLDRISASARSEVVKRLRFSPLAIRWFVLAVEAGNDPLQLVRNQDELLEFCVRSVYDSLDDPAKDVLSALAVLGRGVTVDELVVFLQSSMDGINIGLQELMRGSLVRRESASTPGDINLRVVLTETATQFLSTRAAPDDSMRREITRRELEYRATEERRAVDLAARSLAPVVVRSRTEADAPTAQILRKAMLTAQSGDLVEALEQVTVARRLNPDFWEVDRVEGFLHSTKGNLEAATGCYTRAYKNSSGEDRGVVAHFFAGHLARHVRDVKSALKYAEEANDCLGTPDTAMALGTYKIWSHSFSEGIQLIEPTTSQLPGRARLIAISSLADGYCRWAAYSRAEERNPLLQYQRGRQGLEIALAALESGVADERLRATATDCAIEALRGVQECLRQGNQLVALADWLDGMAKVLVRFISARQWSMLCNEIQKLGRVPNCPAAGKRLAAVALEISKQETAAWSGGREVAEGETLIGEIVTLRDNFGFLRHPAFPDNIFFHKGDMSDPSAFASLNTGALVRFTASATQKGDRAVGIERMTQ